ncbi:glycosyltransferase family 2 protein [Thalassotalea sp. PS06]|uniref:glycosyltransferase family 2 protein n=1 Tax=Thalassotalea sp. PS06 TaxID=2594005 RepID=UPI0011625126|nr:glycosyltransferase family A protein [Thalassotalea sp. PS06]QDP00150.1 glycosyltransferase family 2 protein [Thalassotalea sp. PS06]
MKISVIIPFYRRQHCFHNSLASVLAQTYPVHEIIVVDDNSQGDASEYLSQFSQHVKLISLGQNVGAAQARNIGVSAASGDFVAFLDSDDTWHPQKLANQVIFLQSHPDIKVSHTGCRNVYANGKVNTFNDKPAILQFKDQLLENQFKIQSAMIDRDYFLSLGGFTQHMRNCQDYELAMRIITRGDKIAFLTKPLTDIHQGHEDKLTNRSWAVFKGQMKVTWIYRRHYIETLGFFGALACVSKRFERLGYAKGGARGYVLRKLAQFSLLVLPSDKLQATKGT